MPAKTATKGEKRKKSKRERRAGNRLTFRQTQRIAPYESGPLPPDHAFFIVPFSDISHGGFSYLADRVPDFVTLVVAMEIHQQVVLMRARVMNHRKSGQQYIIGCRFEGKFESKEN